MTEPQKQNNNTKWLIGCGGCLGVLLVVSVLIGVLVYFGVSKGGEYVAQSTTKVQEQTFGKELPPDQKVIFGLELQGTGFMMLSNATMMTLAVDTPLTDDDLAGVDFSKPETMTVLIKKFMAQSSSQRNVQDLTVEGHQEFTTETGNHYTAFWLKMVDEKGNVAPIVVAALRQPNNRGVFLMGFPLSDSRHQDPSVDFTAEYTNLSEQLHRLINQTRLGKFPQGETEQQTSS